MNSTKFILESKVNKEKKLFQKYTKERLKISQNLFCKTLLSHYACVNSLAFSKDEELFVSGRKDYNMYSPLQVFYKNNVFLVQPQYS